MAEQKKAAAAAEGVTTRDDKNDLGVPMLPGDGSEPTGPEDALGVGPKRGDYSNRIGPANYQPHEAVVVDGELSLQQQLPRVDEVGDEKGVKGGTQLPS